MQLSPGSRHVPSVHERVLVTGGGGFIGHAVIRALHARGNDVVIVDGATNQARQRSNVAALRRLEGESTLTFVDDDLLAIDLPQLLRSVDAVVHLAGSPGVQTSWAAGFDHHVRNNVVTTQRLLEAALDSPVRRMIVASSSSVYGHVQHGAADESAPVQPLSPYGASKAAMEHVIGAYVERGLDVTPLRYFTVYGPGQRPDMAMHRMIGALATGAPFPRRGDGSQVRNYTFIEDVARATLAALDTSTPSGAPINVGGGETASVNEVLAMIAELHGSEVPLEQVSVVPGDPQRTSANVDRAAEWLGWTPSTDLRTGLAAQLDWQLAGRSDPAPSAATAA